MAMTGVDWWAVIAATFAGVSLALRGYMLKPSLGKWVDAPFAVWFWLLTLAIVEGGAVMSITGGAHATGREALVHSILAVTASVMLANLARQQVETNPLRAILAHLDEAARVAVHAAMDKAKRRPGRGWWPL